MKAPPVYTHAKKVAATGPAGVAYHTHHIVSAYHSAMKSITQPTIAPNERREPSYREESTNIGTNPPNITRPDRPLHPDAIMTAAKATNKKF
jgi:hypothetical protein